MLPLRYDATVRFLAEPDAPQWRGRLHVYGLDFRDLTALECFCAYVTVTYPRLDAIVNNACQTVRRPPAYYAHLIDGERSLLQYHPAAAAATSSSAAAASTTGPAPSAEAAAARTVLSGQFAYLRAMQAHVPADTAVLTDQSGPSPPPHPSARSNPHDAIHSQVSRVGDDNGDMVAARHLVQAALASSALTQVPLMPGDEVAPSTDAGALFPIGATDVNGQQVDTRTHNSWTMRLHEVSTPELAEVFAINAMAPAIINARLKPLMERDAKALKFIVNVSAMEGKFYRFKNETHPHTNMAKAALNMMTRTSAQDFVKSRIYMTAGACAVFFVGSLVVPVTPNI